LELSDAALLLAQLLLESKVKAGIVSPTVPESHPLPYPSQQLHQIKVRVTIDQIVLQ